MNFGIAIDRIKKIDINNLHNCGYSEQEKRYSNGSLLYEYLRRMSVFQMNFKDIQMPYPYCDVFECLGKNIKNNEMVFIENLSNVAVKTNVKGYLKWNYLMDLEDEIISGFENIYEPMIMIYERGLLPKREQGFIEFGLVGINIGRKESYAKKKTQDISLKELDRIDKTGEI